VIAASIMLLLPRYETAGEPNSAQTALTPLATE
jgi:hypothetical protein